MANTVVFKLTGSNDVWVADLAEGTVKSVAQPAGTDFETASDEASSLTGIEFASVVGAPSQAFASHVDF